RPRDVVLLTHPRNLAEPDVSAAARRVARGCRLFALAVDADGRTELSELKRGSPGALARVRVGMTAPVAQPDPRQVADVLPPWTGDVEPIPYPFQIGLVERLDLHRFDLDHDGQWLVALTAGGFLHLWKTDGSQSEILPRGRSDGCFLERVEYVIGTAGGCVVCGPIGEDLAVVHYQFGTRAVATYRLGPAESRSWEWFYFREHHSVVAVGRPPGGFPNLRYGVDLATREVRTIRDFGYSDSQRLYRACLATLAYRVCPPLIRAAGSTGTEDDVGPVLHLAARTGTLRLTEGGTERFAITPVSDGQPVLRNGALTGEARMAGQTLAVITGRGTQKD